MMGYDMMGGWNWLGVLLGIALVVLIVVGIAWLVRERDERPRGRSALEALELRYARGDVDREVYLATRRDLEADGS